MSEFFYKYVCTTDTCPENQSHIKDLIKIQKLTKHNIGDALCLKCGYPLKKITYNIQKFLKNSKLVLNSELNKNK